MSTDIFSLAETPNHVLPTVNVAHTVSISQLMGHHALPALDPNKSRPVEIDAFTAALNQITPVSSEAICNCTIH